MKIICFILLIGIFNMGCSKNRDKSSTSDSQSTVFVIELEGLPLLPSNFNDQEVNDTLLNILGRYGQVKLLDFSEFEKTRLSNASLAKPYADMRISALPLYEGAPCSFQKELPVVRVDCQFFGIKPEVVNQQNNRWNEERFLQITDNQEENTRKIKAALSGITEDFFEWFKKCYPKENVVFYWFNGDEGTIKEEDHKSSENINWSAPQKMVQK